jgi:hypothetical protein
LSLPDEGLSLSLPDEGISLSVPDESLFLSIPDEGFIVRTIRLCNNLHQVGSMSKYSTHNMCL